MRILITGSRRWTDRAAIETALRSAAAGHSPREVTVVHGECPYGGADIIAAAIADRLGFVVEPHPAAWKVHGKAAGPMRNQEMVDLGAHLCLAFPDAESRGTWDCVRRAAAAGIRVIVDVGAGPYDYTTNESRAVQ
ncbi:SLOG family protein [Mycobacteroides chelonae]|uniref:SLOG family protein n=1 Tax=Mycobacteroides chelonae TaxID=1774 RepID=UPI0009BD7A37|nr:SLOG family protein [Mycobacteroides chelonae]